MELDGDDQLHSARRYEQSNRRVGLADSGLFDCSRSSQDREGRSLTGRGDPAMHAVISAIEYFLPSGAVSTAELSSEVPGWSVEEIDAKTRIQCRHIAGPDECAS